jgi:sulfoxide reductase heme-binding subunit YedZ
MFSPRTRKRIVQHHLPIALGSAVALAVLLTAARGHKGAAFRWSLATAYVSLTLLAATFVTGPVAVLQSRRHPVSSDLRRDFGIWAGIIAIAHFVIGWQVHMKHRYEYWLRSLPDSHLLVPRLDLFGFANYTGLVAVLIVVVLLALSNDRSLRVLGAHRWKELQRWSYWLAVLVILHGAAYEIQEHRALGFVLAGVVVATFAGVLQLQGWKAQRRARTLKTQRADQ